MVGSTYFRHQFLVCRHVAHVFSSFQTACRSRCCALIEPPSPERRPTAARCRAVDEKPIRGESMTTFCSGIDVVSVERGECVDVKKGAPR